MLFVDPLPKLPSYPGPVVDKNKDKNEDESQSKSNQQSDAQSLELMSAIYYGQHGNEQVLTFSYRFIKPQQNKGQLLIKVKVVGWFLYS